MSTKASRKTSARATAITCALVAAGGALWVGVSETAFAHHSFSMFDMKTMKTITGTVKQFEWTNPHTWLWIYVPNDKGEQEQWGIEGMSPNYLGRRGWSKNTLKPGDNFGGASQTNPSYFAPSYYRAFARVTGDSTWMAVLDQSYSILAAASGANGRVAYLVRTR